MITERELRNAIRECHEQKNPNANTCLKLASYYTILNNIVEPDEDIGYSYAHAPSQEKTIEYNGDSEFAKVIQNKSFDKVMPVLEELMATVKVLHPRMYDAVIIKLME